MPPRHHRTVDRITAILELVARNRRGITLSSISRTLDAPRSSIQELTNGLTINGYLVERDQKFFIGPGPFVLTLMANRLAAQALSHELLEDLHSKVGLSILAGVGVGDSAVYFDYVGKNHLLEVVARNHSRRSIYATASGKTILSAMKPDEMDELIFSATARDKEAADRFLTELPKIRETRLAFNYGVTIPDIAAVATPLYDKHGQFIASICVAVEIERQDELEMIGEKLRAVVGEVQI